MKTEKNEPRGYFEKLLAMDCETTGLKYNADDPSGGYQAVSWGLIVANALTLKPIEEMYIEIKWNGMSTWSQEAEQVHGLTKEHLNKNGPLTC